jgi:hypothetical protein
MALLCTYPTPETTVVTAELLTKHSTQLFKWIYFKLYTNMYTNRAKEWGYKGINHSKHQVSCYKQPFSKQSYLEKEKRTAKKSKIVCQRHKEFESANVIRVFMAAP